MSCVCCSQGCPPAGARAKEGDRFCRQCQMEGCPAPTVVDGSRIKLEATNRGFYHGEFIDRYGEKCSIQESSLATERCIWLGVNNVFPQVLGPVGTGWQPVPLPPGATTSGRMHLNQQMVKDLLPLLQHFAETGDLPAEPLAAE